MGDYGCCSAPRAKKEAAGCETSSPAGVYGLAGMDLILNLSYLTVIFSDGSKYVDSGSLY